MTESAPPVDLGTTLRALRRAADLSQRELAEKSGVPQATIARIESGRTPDPGFRTVERLVGAVAGRLTIAATTAAPASGVSETRRLPAVPHEELRDAGGRHCPAHLDAREVREPRDWPGAWWAHWYALPPGRWPRLPAVTFRLDRSERDRRRRRERVRRETRIRRCHDGDLPPTSWRFMAELPDGEMVGELRAHERSVDLLLGHDVGGGREIVLDGVLVAGAYRQLGIGRRLVEALSAEMDRAGVSTAHAVAEFGGIGFLIACGYRLQASRPAALRLDRPAGAALRLDPPISAAPQQPR